MAIFGLGRNKNYGTDTRKRYLSDEELLAKEKRISERNAEKYAKKNSDSTLRNMWYALKTLFEPEEFMTSSEQRRLKAIHNGSSTNKANNAQSIWTVKDKKE